VVIQSKFNTINVEPPAEVYDLYEWKNGLKEEIMNGGKTIGEMRLFTSAIFPNFNFSYQAHINFSSAGYWEKSHFPIFCSGVGDYYVIECDKTSLSYGKVFYFSPSDPDFEGLIAIYDSLSALIVTAIECYKSKAYTIGILNSLKEDLPAVIEISKLNNPESEYWKLDWN
jgi:hypothetical protein